MADQNNTSVTATLTADWYPRGEVGGGDEIATMKNYKMQLGKANYKIRGNFFFLVTLDYSPLNPGVYVCHVLISFLRSFYQ